MTHGLTEPLLDYSRPSDSKDEIGDVAVIILLRS